jgi:hypothetical protein
VNECSNKFLKTSIACVIAWAAALVICLQPHGELSSNRYFPFYHAQAEAFLDGRTDIIFSQGMWPQDSIPHEGKHYLAMGPLNGFLMVPFVTLGLSERVFTLTLLALFLFVLCRFLQFHVEWRSRWDGPLWILFFSLGTVLIVCVSAATAWFSACVSAFLFVSLGGLLLLEGQRKAYGFQTLWFALGLSAFCLAALSRFHLGLLLPMALMAVYFSYRESNKSYSIRGWLPVFIPLVLYSCFLAWWNWNRFGNPLSLKYSEHQFAGHFQNWIEQFGFTNLRYVFAHIYHGLIGFPELTPAWPFIKFNENGNGLFALSPLLLIIFFRSAKFGRREWFSVACAVLVCIPVFTHFSTGWRQFGYRYALDFLPFVGYLATRAQFSISSALGISLVTLSVIMNVAAALLMTAY